MRPEMHVADLTICYAMQYLDDAILTNALTGRSRLSAVVTSCPTRYHPQAANSSITRSWCSKQRELSHEQLVLAHEHGRKRSSPRKAKIHRYQTADGEQHTRPHESRKARSVWFISDMHEGGVRSLVHCMNIQPEDALFLSRSQTLPASAMSERRDGRSLPPP